jgi:hypothetical protein
LALREREERERVSEKGSRDIGDRNVSIRNGV